METILKEKIYIINGPNLNKLGTREPDKYGTLNLQEIEDICKHEIICKGKKINIYEENILIFFEKKNRLIL